MIEEKDGCASLSRRDAIQVETKIVSRTGASERDAIVQILSLRDTTSLGRAFSTDIPALRAISNVGRGQSGLANVSCGHLGASSVDVVPNPSCS